MSHTNTCIYKTHTYTHFHLQRTLSDIMRLWTGKNVFTFQKMSSFYWLKCQCSLCSKNRNIHTLCNIQWPQAWYVGHNNAVNSSQDTPRWSQSAVPTPVVQPLATICILLEAQRGRGAERMKRRIDCVPLKVILHYLITEHTP